MHTALRLGWLEVKLLLREPLTVVFSLVLPLIVLFVLGGVFGNEPSKPGEMVVYRGVGPITYYVPAYVALVVASVCVISIPTHLATNRERGVLKRYHASGISAASIAGAELVVVFALSAISAALLLVAAWISYDFESPRSVPAVVGVFIVLALGFAAFGLLLGALAPTARAAQALGMLLWFVMLFLGGAGPPPEVLGGAMHVVSVVTPLLHAVRIMQSAWLGLDAGWSWLVFGGMFAVCTVLGIRLFRWE